MRRFFFLRDISCVKFLVILAPRLLEYFIGCSVGQCSLHTNIEKFKELQREKGKVSKDVPASQSVTNQRRYFNQLRFEREKKLWPNAARAETTNLIEF